MRGHVQQRGKDSFRVKAYVGMDERGRRRYVERTVRGGRREAERVLSRLIGEVDAGTLVAPTTMTVSELLDQWLDVKARLVTPTTWEGYRWCIERYIRPHLGHRKISQIRPVELDGFYADLLKGGGLKGEPLSPTTVRMCHGVLRQSMRQARKWGLIGRSPVEDATPPRLLRHEIDPPSVDDVRRLLAAADEIDPDFGMYLRLLAATGCRRGEGLGVKWGDINTGTGELWLRRSIASVKGNPVEKDTKTHQSRRVALDQMTLQLLESHRIRAVERAFALGVRITAQCYVFPGDPSGRLPARPDVATNRFIRLRDSLGLAGVRLHDLRHFTATTLGAAGTPIATISSRLGHRDRSTTLNIYSHTFPALDHQAAVAIGAFLDGEPPARADIR